MRVHLEPSGDPSPNSDCAPTEGNGALMLHRASCRFRARLSADGAPSATDLEAINAMKHRVLVARTPDNCVVRTFDALSTRELRGYMEGCYVPEMSLQQIASLAYDTPIQCNHDTYSANGLPVGRTFRAQMVMDDQGDPCVRMTYFSPLTASTEELDGRIMGGAIGEVSCSFGYTKLECSICHGDVWDQESGCAHLPGETYEGRRMMAAVLGVDEYEETSFVWKGAAEGTRFRIAAAHYSSDFGDLMASKRSRLAETTTTAEMNILERLAAGERTAREEYEAKFRKLFGSTK